jgi:hypothetical protein
MTTRRRSSRGRRVAAVAEKEEEEQEEEQEDKGETIGQQVIDALPPTIKEFAKTHTELSAPLAGATSMRNAMYALMSMARAHSIDQRKRLLIKLDHNRYHSAWICNDCGCRWGRHDSTTLACPKKDSETHLE